MEIEKIKSELLSQIDEINEEFLERLQKNAFFTETNISIAYFNERYSKQFLLHYISILHTVSTDLPLFMTDFLKDSLLFDESETLLHIILLPYTLFKDIIISRLISLECKDINKILASLSKEQAVYSKNMISKYSILKNYEENLYHKYKQLLNLNIIVSKADLSGNIKYVNEAFCEISGYDKNELIGAHHNIIRHPEVSSFVFQNLWDTIRNGNIWQGILKNKRKDGSSYWVQGIIVPVILNNKITEYVSLRIDISQNILNRDLNNFLLRQYDYYLFVENDLISEFNGPKQYFIDNNFEPVNNHINDFLYNLAIDKKKFFEENLVISEGRVYQITRYKYNQSSTVVLMKLVDKG